MDSNGKPLIEGAKYSLFMVDPQSVSNKKRTFIKVYNGPKYADGITFFEFDGEGYRQGEISRGSVKVTYNSPGSTNVSGFKGGRRTTKNKSARRKTKTRRYQRG